MGPEVAAEVGTMVVEILVQGQQQQPLRKMVAVAVGIMAVEILEEDQ